MKPILDIDSAPPIPVGPVQYYKVPWASKAHEAKKMYGVLLFTKKEKKRAVLAPRCIRVFDILASNVGDYFPRKVLEKPGLGKTHLKGVVSAIRGALKQIDAQDDLWIPDATKGGGPYRLEWIKPSEATPNREQPSDDRTNVNGIGPSQRLNAVDNKKEATDALHEGLCDPDAFKVFANWDAADPIAAEAEESITIIDSLYKDRADFERVLRKMKHADKKLSIKLYMATPSLPFGSQRYREIEKPGTSEKTAEILASGPSDQERVDYAKEFDRVSKLLVSSVNKANKSRQAPVSFSILEYPFMLSLRFVVVDTNRIVWGWFPIFDSNPGYSCLYIDGTKRLGDEVKTLFEYLKQQVEHVEDVGAHFTERRKGAITSKEAKPPKAANRRRT